VRLGVNRAEGSVEIRRERISRLDRLRDGAEEPQGIQGVPETLPVVNAYFWPYTYVMLFSGNVPTAKIA
jgi:hypothetical protein